MIRPMHSIFTHLILKDQLSLTPAPTMYIINSLPHRRSHLPCSVQLVQVDATGEQVACGGQADSDHPPASMPCIATGGASGRDDALDPSVSWLGGCASIGYLGDG